MVFPETSRQMGILNRLPSANRRFSTTLDRCLDAESQEKKGLSKRGTHEL